MSRPLALLWLSLALSAPRVYAEADIPPENRADQAAPPPRPAEDAAQEPARRLFAAIVEDKPELAADFFFPRDAFLRVKAMARPDRYYDRLAARFATDVHALHRTLRGAPAPTFERLELPRRGGWVRVGEEGNRLPYWASRHARLHYRVAGEQRTLEVRVLITWGSRWYVIHLSDF
ncbi:MAG: hypothetical protein ABW252_26405 [Polyangiales bacterium]